MMGKDRGNIFSGGENMTNGERFKQLRQQVGLSVPELAKRTETSMAHIYRIESGERENPSIAVINDLARGLGIKAVEVAKAFGLDH